MRRFWLAWWPTGRTAVGYSAALAVSVLCWWSLAPAAQQAWLGWASTDLVNLRHDPLGCLVGSALITDDRPWAWVALVGLGAAGRALGNLRTLWLVLIAHVVATLVSEGLLALRITTGREPVSARTVVDVGPSYVVVSALVVGLAYAGLLARIASAGCFAAVAPFLFGGLFSGDVWALGHLTACAVGLVLGFPLHRSWRRVNLRRRTSPTGDASHRPRGSRPPAYVAQWPRTERNPHDGDCQCR